MGGGWAGGGGRGGRAGARAARGARRGRRGRGRGARGAGQGAAAAAARGGGGGRRRRARACTAAPTEGRIRKPAHGPAASFAVRCHDTSSSRSPGQSYANAPARTAPRAASAAAASGGTRCSKASNTCAGLGLV